MHRYDEASNEGQRKREDISSMYVIREIYESESSTDAFLMQLERALLSRVQYIAIEPKRLAEETGRWIMLGNILARLSVLSGLASITVSIVAPKQVYVALPLAGVSLVSRGFFDISWSFDPCSQYQVMSSNKRDTLNESITKSATKVLVYKDNTIANAAQRTVTVVALIFCGVQLYRYLK